MGAMASQVTSLTIVYSTVYTGQNKENIKSPRRWPVNSPHKGPVTREMFPFDDVIMDKKMDKGIAGPKLYLHLHQVLRKVTVIDTLL